MEYSRDSNSGAILMRDRTEVEKCKRLIKEREAMNMQSRHIISQDMIIASLKNQISELEQRVTKLERMLQITQSDSI